MEDSADECIGPVRTVSKDTHLHPYDAPRWITPNRNRLTEQPPSTVPEQSTGPAPGGGFYQRLKAGMARLRFWRNG